MEAAMNKHNLFIFNFNKNITFAGKLFLFTTIIWGYFNHVMPQYDGEYNSALIDKVERLESIDEPKIVLLGNSNLAFGMDSPLLEENMGMPVVNMGLHGGVGNAFHEEMARLNVHEGDIYILCHTDFSDNDTIEDPTLTWLTIENHYSLWRILRKKDVLPMMKAFPNYVKKSFDLYISDTGNQDVGGVYSRSSFNAYGDVSVLREGTIIDFDTPVEPPLINDTTINRINKLNKWLNQRGATLLVASYPIGNGDMTADPSQFVSFQEELAAKLDCTIISNYTDYMFDYSYFYDTYYHLNTAGVELRTQQLIKDLQHWKEESENAF